MKHRMRATTRREQLVSVGQPAYMKLMVWGDMLYRAFGARAYHVGSSVTSKDWRDVDVVILLDEKEWADLFGTLHGNEGEARYNVLCTALSVWGKEFTGLPIDFKFQPRDHANEKYASKDGHYRSALVISRHEDWDRQSLKGAGEK